MPIHVWNKIENNVVGYAAPSQLSLIEQWAKEVPENGIVVEIGSFAGRSAWHWAKSCHPSVTVYAVDSWSELLYSKHKPVEIRKKLRGNSIDPMKVSCTLEDFLFNVRDCPNIIPVQARSPNIPTEILDKLVNIDAVYIDDSHVNPEFKINFEFWHKRLKPKGIFCGDDFYAPDVHRTVCQWAMHNQKQLYARSNFWRLYDWDDKIDLND